MYDNSCFTKVKYIMHKLVRRYMDLNEHQTVQLKVADDDLVINEC